MKINESTKIKRNKKKEYWLITSESKLLAETVEEIRLIKDLRHLAKVKSNEELIGQLKEDLIASLTSKIINRQSANANTVEQPNEVANEIKPYMREHHLVKYLYDNNLKLTQKELDCLQAIFGQGSFYEESANYNEETKEYYVADYPTFIGWEITEEEVKGCRGALASLVKKGILEIGSDDVNGEKMATYYIKYTPDFKKDTEYYHELDIPTELIK